MKFDDLITQVYNRKKEDKENREVGCATLEEKFEKPLKGCNFPPCAYVRFECMSLLHESLVTNVGTYGIFSHQ